MSLDDTLCCPGHGLCQGMGLEAGGRGDGAEHPLGLDAETPKGIWTLPARAEQRQGPGSKSPPPAVGTGLSAGIKPQDWGPVVPPSQVPILAGRAALARVLWRGGLGEDSGR